MADIGLGGDQTLDHAERAACRALIQQLRQHRIAIPVDIVDVCFGFQQHYDTTTHKTRRCHPY